MGAGASAVHNDGIRQIAQVEGSKPKDGSDVQDLA
eukprot:CAMPEP_0118860546 /NCGR_PEP_ID=MMETSP1163-20130328/6324_1 /TAXON_ID=124430 /ORGANISM="Phaeomonas parva, Strain CCMP2877" /LENGTH=34 /DNA_ID= /DNA_START= /DNA_END= /DNA_ORIENTATION=